MTSYISISSPGNYTSVKTFFFFLNPYSVITNAWESHGNSFFSNTQLCFNTKSTLSLYRLSPYLTLNPKRKWKWLTSATKKLMKETKSLAFSLLTTINIIIITITISITLTAKSTDSPMAPMPVSTPMRTWRKRYSKLPPLLPSSSLPPLPQVTFAAVSPLWRANP